jgi:hypothetical protein
VIRHGLVLYGNGQLRSLIHFSDGGSGMRMRDEPLEPGTELDDAGGRYRVIRVEPAGVRPR